MPRDHPVPRHFADERVNPIQQKLRHGMFSKVLEAPCSHRLMFSVVIAHRAAKSCSGGKGAMRVSKSIRQARLPDVFPAFEPPHA